MVSNLTDQVPSISEVNVQGNTLGLTMTLNSIVARLSRLVTEVTRVLLEVGTGDVQGMLKVRFHKQFAFYFILLQQCQLDGHGSDQ